MERKTSQNICGIENCTGCKNSFEGDTRHRQNPIRKTSLKKVPLKKKRTLVGSSIISKGKRASTGKSKPNKKKSKSISKWKKELDSIFSLYIRTRDKGQCYTCPRKDEIKKMQNGHFVPRQYLSVRWDEVNNHCQCYACNMLYNGQPGAYAVRLEIDYGPGTVARLEGQRKELVRLKQDFYEAKIAEYTAKYKALLEEEPLSTPPQE